MKLAYQWQRSAVLKYLSVALLLLLFAGLSLSSVLRQGWTVDEPHHLRYGLQLLSGDATRFDDSKMPISALNAIPRALGETQLFQGISSAFLHSDMAARAITTIWGVILGAVIFMWSRMLFGFASGLLSLSLYALSPAFIAHSAYVTTDVPFAFFFFSSCFSFWLWSIRMRSALFLIVSTAGAFLSKYASLLLPPIFILLAVVGLLSKVPTRSVREYLTLVVVLLVCVVVSINVAFVFDRSDISVVGEFSSYNATVNRMFRFITELRVVPFPYLQGIRWVVDNEATGATFGRPYLFGELRNLSAGEPPFKFFYPATFLIKETLPFLSLLLIGSCLLVRNHWADARLRMPRSYIMDVFYLLAPGILMAIYLCCFTSAQMGYRYWLWVLPFLYAFSGIALQIARNKAGKALILGLLVWNLVTVLNYFPHFIAYTNELVFDKLRAHELIADSSLDYGGARVNYWKDKFLASHPVAVFEPETPQPGIIVVSVNRLLGIIDVPAERYQWLRDYYQPVSHIGYSLLVYDIPDPMPFVVIFPEGISEVTSLNGAKVLSVALSQDPLEGDPFIKGEILIPEHFCSDESTVPFEIIVQGSVVLPHGGVFSLEADADDELEIKTAGITLFRTNHPQRMILARNAGRVPLTLRMKNNIGRYCFNAKFFNHSGNLVASIPQNLVFDDNS